MNKIISMTDSKYFDVGNLFLETVQRIKAHVVVYAPDLTNPQQAILRDRGIEYRHVEPEKFKTQMQSLKFRFLNENIDGEDNSLITFCDWDTFFIRDWSRNIHKDIALGITIRDEMIAHKCLRAYSNGGVIFVRNSLAGHHMMTHAIKTIWNWGRDDIPEYDEVWKTLENKNRPAHKRHERDNLRWWCDQVYLSALVYRHLKSCDISRPMKFGKENNVVRFYNCDSYNQCEADPVISDELGVYIKHLKSKSGAKVNQKDG